MKKLSESLAELAGLPKDVVMDLPKISVSGDREIFIENHKGLVLYSPGEIRVRMKGGIITVKGVGLSIISIEYNNILINGLFKGVFYE